MRLQHGETVDHIVSRCEALAKTEYISRHSDAFSIGASVKNMISVLKTNGTNTKDNNNIMMWDMPVNTNGTTKANRPDIVVKESVNSPAK